MGIIDASMRIPGTTLHTSLSVGAIKDYLGVYTPARASDILLEPPADPVRTWRAPLLGCEIASHDFEDPVLPARELLMSRALNWALPLRDPDARWASPDEARASMAREFAGMIRPRVDWRAPLSDEALALFVRQGLAAHLLTRDEGGEGYRVDLLAMRRYPTRRGLQPYGARLRLSPALEPVAIDWEGSTRRPGGVDWEVAKLVFRASVAAIVTIRDHALYCHFKVANAACVATRGSLAPAHPVRLLLRPFLYRTAKINFDGYTMLVRRRAIFHRLFAFTWRGLRALYADALSSFTMRTLPESLARRGVAELEGYAYGEDAARVWSIVCDYARAQLARDYQSDARVDGDAALQRWWTRLRDTAGSALPLRGVAGLVELCARLIFNAVAVHEQVGGSIGDYLTHPGFAPPALQRGRAPEEMWASKNTLYQAYMLGALTNLRMPRVLEDLSGALPDEHARACMRGFQAALTAWARELERRNAGRPQPMRTFDPTSMEVSVSI